MVTQEYYVGIDPSASSTGVSIISSDGSKEVFTIQPGGLRGAERLLFISSRLLSGILGKRVACCFIESPAYDAIHKEFILGEVLGCIKLTLIQAGVTNIKDATPTQVKKFMAGSGRATKDEVSVAAVLDGCPASQTDITDSWSLARIAQAVHTNKCPVAKRASIEVISALTKVAKTK